MTDLSQTQLMEAILEQIARVWGDDDGLEGEPAEYEWLMAHYGISQDEDIKWHLLLQDNMGDLPEEDAEDPEVQAFLEDEAAVLGFLRMFLEKYRASDAVYPG
jgi:hypothetical protein